MTNTKQYGDNEMEFGYTSLKKMLKTGIYVSMLVTCAGYLSYKYVDYKAMRRLRDSVFRK